MEGLGNRHQDAERRRGTGNCPFCGGVVFWLYLGSAILLPGLAEVAPALAVAGILLQLVTGELNGAVGAAGGGEHGVEPLHGNV